tara:strand:+ start:183 stop:800 length:618 start_codon:yes stop_codon:yes gene_type:complete
MYYPKSQIQTDLYTNGGEYQLNSDKTEYIGYYFKNSNEECFSGRNPNNPPNFPLSPLVSTNISNSREEENLPNSYYLINDQYFWATNKNPNEGLTPPSIPSQTIVLPTKDEYKIGEFQRYFVSKNNEPYYIEISQNEYNQYESREPNVSWQLYTPFQFPWLLTGDRNEVYNVNRNTVKRISSNLKLIGFPSYFKGRYDQYYKDPT